MEYDINIDWLYDSDYSLLSHDPAIKFLFELFPFCLYIPTSSNFQRLVVQLSLPKWLF